MADWRTYAKAARNTARRQAPEARDAAQRATARAGDYARAAGRAIDEGLHGEDQPPEDTEDRAPGPRPTGGAPDQATRPPAAEETADQASRPSAPGDTTDEASRPPAAEGAPDRPTGPRSTSPSSAGPPPTATRERPAVDTDSLRKDAAAYYTVAERRLRAAQVVPRFLRALRDALLIGLSVLVIWLVLGAAGLQIPFGAVVVVVVVIFAASFAAGLYARFRRDGAAGSDAPDDPEA